MEFRTFLRVVGFEVVLSLGILGAVVMYVDPTTSGIPGLFLFYGSVFFFISGLCVWFLSWCRGRRAEAEELPGKLGVSVRQGVSLGLLTVLLLVLQSFRVLVWWVGVIVIVVFVFLEVVFLLRHHR